MSQLNLVFYALSDSTRRDMVERLAASEFTIGQLAEPYQMSMPAITKHVKVLEQAGLVTKRREGKFTHCRLQLEKLELVDQWIVQQRKYWESQLENLAGFLQNQDPGKRQKVGSPKAGKAKSKAISKNDKGKKR